MTELPLRRGPKTDTAPSRRLFIPPLAVLGRLCHGSYSQHC